MRKRRFALGRGRVCALLRVIKVVENNTLARQRLLEFRIADVQLQCGVESGADGRTLREKAAEPQEDTNVRGKVRRG